MGAQDIKSKVKANIKNFLINILYKFWGSYNWYNITMKKYSSYFWLAVILFFLGFIGIMSYWYPVTADEYFRWQTPFVWEMVKDAYFSIVPRISFIFSIPIFYLGKWSFVLLNPLIQLINCFLIFYIVFLRFPKVDDFKDMPYFLIIMCMSTFLVCSPSEVTFWISGAFNYSWMILPFLVMLCFLRQIYAHSFIFHDIWVVKIGFFILGFFIGMSNEALAPIALGFAVCFGVICHFKWMKAPRSLSFLIFGLAIGCLVFFSAPAHYSKMLVEGVSNASSASLGNKLFFHLSHFNDLFEAQFFLPVFTGLFLFIAVLDIKNKKLKAEYFWFSLALLAFGFLSAFILFVVPQPPLRAYYPASVVFVISFLFLVRYYGEAYKLNFAKILCICIITGSLCMAPRYIYPHYFLHIQEKERVGILKQNPDANVKPYVVLKGPTENLTIGLTDWANKVDIGNDMYITVSTEPINW